MRHNFIYYYSIFTLTLAFVVFFYVAWLLLAPVQLDEVHNEPFPVHPTELHKGDTIFWEIEYSKNNPYKAFINRNIICGDNLVTLAPEETDAPWGYRIVAKGEVVLPEKVSIGTCYIELKATYEINKLRDIQKTFRTQEFIIKDKE
jgi:hypothetical protein